MVWTVEMANYIVSISQIWAYTEKFSCCAQFPSISCVLSEIISQIWAYTEKFSSTAQFSYRFWALTPYFFLYAQKAECDFSLGLFCGIWNLIVGISEQFFSICPNWAYGWGGVLAPHLLNSAVRTQELCSFVHGRLRSASVIAYVDIIPWLADFSIKKWFSGWQIFFLLV